MKRTSGAVGVAVTVVLALAFSACGDGGGSNDDVLGLGEPLSRDRGADVVTASLR